MYLFTALMLILIASCAPPGKSTRLIKAPYQDQDSTLNSSRVLAPQPILDRGLPKQCSIITSLIHKDKACIQCLGDPLIIRCIDSNEPLEAEQHCKFRGNTLKCIRDTSFIKLSLDKPEELTFRHQFLSLLQLLNMIVQDKVSDPEEKQIISKILQVFEDHSENFFDDQVTLILISSLNSISGGAKRDVFQKIFYDLDTLRVLGRLDQESPKNFIEDVLNQFPKIETLVSIVKDLNTQGIQDPE